MIAICQFLTLLYAVLWQTEVTSTTKIPEVFITISSLASVKYPNEITEREIQLNWYNAEPTKGDWVGLFNYEPRTDNISKPLVKHEVKSGEGVHTSNISMHRPAFEGNLQRHCLGFWVAYVRNGSVIASNCIKIEPTWMHDHRHVIGNLTFPKIFIPGTHDAGSFQPYRAWRDENIFTKYKITQDEDLWNQFVYGIRHIDLRIAYYPKINQFYINHGAFRINSFVPQLHSIRKFLDSTKEFLILDFHSFETGFESWRIDIKERHESLISLLKEYLGHLIIPRTRGSKTTLNELWNSNQRVLIMYNDDTYYKQSDLLWPGLYQAWANVIDVNALRKYFTKLFNAMDMSGVWSAQAELTPNLLYVPTHLMTGLRPLADQVNLNVTYWFQDLWWHQANCVATDFFLGNNIIEVAIKANKKRRDLNSNSNSNSISNSNSNFN